MGEWVQIYSICFGDFNARRNAKNFTEADLAPAVSYCHLRGVKVYLTLNTLLTDRELPPAAQLAKRASTAASAPEILPPSRSSAILESTWAATFFM